MDGGAADGLDQHLPAELEGVDVEEGAPPRGSDRRAYGRDDDGFGHEGSWGVGAGMARIMLSWVNEATSWPSRRTTRSEERRVGKECVRTCRSRWWPTH